MEPLNKTEEAIRKKLRAQASSSLHDRVLIRVRQAQEQCEETTSAPGEPAIRRMIMRGPIARLTIAAAIIAAVVLGLFEFVGTDSGSGVVWAEVAERLEASGGMIAQMRSSYIQPGLTEPIEWAAKIYSSPQIGYRMESFQDGEAGTTCICKIAERKMVMLTHSSKQYMLRDLTTEDMAEITEKQAGGMDPMAIVQKLLAGEYTEVGREMIDGAEAEGIEIHNPPGGRANFPVDSRVMRLWVSVETGYPVRMETDTVGRNGTVHITQIVDQFEWHLELDPELFELEVPSGYTEMEGVQF
jgi:hypothetical protein